MRRKGGRAAVQLRVVAASFVVACLAAACTPAPHAELVRGADGPLPVEFNVKPLLVALAKDSTTSPPGANDFGCRPSRAHPRPVILVHGLIVTRTYWQTLSPLLANNGYCVFALTYGSPDGIPGLGGIRRIEDSATELAAFVDDVLAATGATEVDLIGHSEGTVMPQYYLKRLGGAEHVRRFVALTPLYEGSTGYGVDGFIRWLEGLPLGLGTAFRDAFETACAACRDALAGSEFLDELYADGVVAVPGVEYTTIVTRFDEIVTPYTSGHLEAPGVHNIVLQDGCPQDHSEHLGILYSPRAAGFVLNALDPEHAEPPPCVPATFVYGTP